MSQYFAGKSATIKIDGYQNSLHARSWNYVSDKSLLDITNSLSFGKEQYIATLKAGTIVMEGYITDTLLNDIINNDIIVQGQEVIVDLFVNADSSLGFSNVDAIVDEFIFNTDINDASTYTMKLLLNEPKI
jgi:hypothetical protein